MLKEIYGKEKRWVTWALEKKDGKLTKIPYQVNGTKASSTDQNTWATYDEVKKAGGNIGIVFTPEQNLLGIDIDHCLKDNEIVHEQKDKIEALIHGSNTYAEISPSGEGLHLFLAIDGALSLTANKHAPFEAYTAGRYFTVTENPYGEARPVRTVSPAEALSLLETIGYPWSKKVKAPVVSSIPVNMDDVTILEKMFRAKNGKEIQALYNGGHGGDKSSEDMSLLAHLAFWTGKNPEQMERIWLSSTLGAREKTQDRKDYRTRSVNNAILNCSKIYESPAQRLVKENPEIDLLFTVNKQKEVIFTQNTENICRVLRHHADFEGRFRYDEFKNTLELRHLGSEKWRELEDNDVVDVQTEISILFPCFGKVGKDMVYDAIIKVSKENRMDSASDYIKTLVWDKTPRVDNWLKMVYGVADTEYHRKVASNWLKGLVKRIVEPGCKFDYVLVLEGEQGSKKSTSLGVLGQNWHVETTISTESKDFFMQMQGKAIVEFSEGETLSRTEVKRMKAIITMQSDKYRPPYERLSRDFPRRCVFAMTTNQEEYLKDETGNRRWLPVRVVFPQANVEWLAENRDQLFAEAYYRVSIDKETVYEFPKEETMAEQAMRRIHDPNGEMIADWYFNILSQADRLSGITIHQVYMQAFQNNLGSRAMTKSEEMNISDVLKTHLKLEKRQTMNDGRRKVKWYNPSESSVKETNEDIISSLERSI